MKYYNKYFIPGIFLLIVFIIIIQSCGQQSNPSHFVAFSLKNAVSTLNKEGTYEQLYEMAGINRIFGFLHDKENDDIILIGGNYKSLPKANFEDFIVSLKSRIIYDEWPKVSIDPNEETYKTKMQKVFFAGHVENTNFGYSLLNADILLKKYGLGLIENEKLKAYSEFVKEDLIIDPNKNVLSFDWLDADSSVVEFDDKPIYSKSNDNYQARFWFYIPSPQSYKFKDLFIITQSDLAISSESLGDNIHSSQTAELFSNQWNNKFYELSLKHEVIGIVKQLFNYVAISEGINKLNNRPIWLNDFCNNYDLNEVSTPDQYKLVKRYGQKISNDNTESLFILSGGIDLEIQEKNVKSIEEGDYQILKNLVIKSRPSKNSIFWSIPLKDCNMPNSGDLPKHIKIKDKKSVGTFISGSEYYINPDLKTRSTDRLKYIGNYSGLNNIPIANTSIPMSLKGVSMKMKIDSSSFRIGDEKLEELREQILKQTKN